jgi:hypothetical protein
MSDTKKFLARWSERKLKPETTEDPRSEKKSATETRVDERRAAESATAEPEFDITQLPSLESIVANSDIRAFLQKGVPSHLRHAALRRAWSADPAIRDFVGLSENSWDFNQPDSLPGFGPIDVEDVRRLAARYFGGAPTETEADSAQAASIKQETSDAPVQQTQVAALEDQSAVRQTQAESDPRAANPASDADAPASSGDHQPDAAAQQEAPDGPPDSHSRPRRHGGALPR